LGDNFGRQFWVTGTVRGQINEMSTLGGQYRHS
jgi:hypothetical protein